MTAASEANGGTEFESRLIVEGHGRSFSGRMNKSAASPSSGKPPLIVAIHGGTYSSAYFDVAGGYSLLALGDRFGVPVIALDRPSYGQSTPLAVADSTIAYNAELLVQAVGRIWAARKDSIGGIFLVGHSIGGAAVVTMAASRPSWPLLGIAVSGVGLAVAPGDDERWAALPEGLVSLPTEIKDFVMFGPEGSYRPEMPAASHVANTTCPRAELIDITSTWPRVVREVTAKVNVPVHYRQAEFDRLWIVDQAQVEGFGKAFTQSPKVDAELFPAVGHCIDFHATAGAFQEQQVKFALDCARRVA